MAGPGKPGPAKGTKRKEGVNRGNAGKGRPKNAPNKATKALKDMILGALESKNGQEWLEDQMDKNPVAFMTLLGKVLPSTLTVANPDGSPLFNRIERVIIATKR